jgi:hypothetical protein
MRFIQQLPSKRQFAASLILILVSVSFQGCTVGSNLCAIPDDGSFTEKSIPCKSDSSGIVRLPETNPPVYDQLKYDHSRGPMNEASNLPIHMTE